jgi:hypothetical protein
MFESNKETNNINQIIYYAIVSLKFSKKKRASHAHIHYIYNRFFLKK